MWRSLALPSGQRSSSYIDASVDMQAITNRIAVAIRRMLRIVERSAAPQQPRHGAPDPARTSGRSAGGDCASSHLLPALIKTLNLSLRLTVDKLRSGVARSIVRDCTDVEPLQPRCHLLGVSLHRHARSEMHGSGELGRIQTQPPYHRVRSGSEHRAKHQPTEDAQSMRPPSVVQLH